jgi:hypothetical protein
MERRRGNRDRVRIKWTQTPKSTFQHAEGQCQLYKALAGKQGGNIVITHIQKYLAAYLSEHLKQQLKKRKNSFPYEILSYSLASSFISLLTWWLDTDSPHSGQQMNEFYRHLVEPGVEVVMAGMFFTS